MQFTYDDTILTLNKAECWNPIYVQNEDTIP